MAQWDGIATELLMQFHWQVQSELPKTHSSYIVIIYFI